jgi:hypothetical protein
MNLYICGNKMPTRCNIRFLLQILLLAQHVSGTIMSIIRSSRVLYRRLLPVLKQQPANRTHNPQLNTIPKASKPNHQSFWSLQPLGFRNDTFKIQQLSGFLLGAKFCAAYSLHKRTIRIPYLYIRSMNKNFYL